MKPAPSASEGFRVNPSLALGAGKDVYAFFAAFHFSTMDRKPAMWAGVVPQQPPTMLTPASSSSGSQDAMYSGVCG